MRFTVLRTSLVAAAVAVIGLSASSAWAPASAALILCNKTSYVLASAIAFQTKGRWVTRGWFMIEPGQCSAALEYKLSDGDYYTHAFTLPAHAGAVKTFAGREKFCTGQGLSEFTIAGQDDCERRGFAERGFARIEVHGKTDWTTTYTEPANYTMEQARIAGVQRLLSDIGRSVAKIDGYLGERTRRSLIAFKRDHKMPQDTTTPSLLYEALVADARAAQQKTGFRICNETAIPAWAALAFSDGPSLTSTGWFKIEPSACTEAIKDRLTGKSYFSYAESDKGAADGLVWGGDHEFCALQTRFTIRGNTNCEKRGFSVLGFRKIDVGKEDGYTQILSADTSTAGRHGMR